MLQRALAHWVGTTIPGAVALAIGGAGCVATPSARSSTPEVAPTLVQAEPEMNVASSAQDPSGQQAIESKKVDLSLVLRVYLAAGVPKIDQPWKPKDYHLALKVLADLAKSDRNVLPRAKSLNSGALFDRLIDRTNFAAVKLNHSDAQDAQLASDYLDVVPYLLGVYAPGSDSIEFEAEQVALVEFVMSIVDVALQVSSNVLAVDSAWEKHYERQQQLAVGIVLGAHEMLGETQRYSSAEQDLITRCLHHYVPRLARHIQVSQRQKLYSKLTRLNLH